MSASPSFLATALTTIQALPEYAAFQTALVTLSQATEDGRQSAWNAAYSDGQPGLSPAYRLRRAIRDVILNTEVSQAVTLSSADREAAYQTLTAQVAPDSTPPGPAPWQMASLTPEDVDLIRMAAARLASD